jgi:hypothetical protein
MTKRPCKVCRSEIDDSPFTDEMITLFEQAEACDDPERRTEMVFELARLFVDAASESDTVVPDDLHETIQAALQAHMKWRASMMRVGRVVIRSLQDMKENPEMWDHLRGHSKTPTPSVGPSKKGKGPTN